MKFRMLHAALFLPASLFALSGCIGPVDGEDAPGVDEADEAEEMIGESEDAWGEASWQWYGDVPGVSCGYTPVLTSCNNYMYMVHGGVGTSQLYFNRYDGNRWLGSAPIPNAYSAYAPSALYANNRLNVVYSDGHSPYYTYYANNQWSIPVALAHVNAAVTPMLAGYGNKMYMVYNDPSSCGYYVSQYGCGGQATTSSCGWGAPQVITGACGYGPPGVAAYQNQLHVAYRGVGANNLYYTSYNRGAWANPLALQGYSGYGFPTLAANRGGLYLSVYDNANNLYWGRFSRGQWGAAQILNRSTAMPVGFTGYRGGLYMAGIGYGANNVFWGGYRGGYGLGGWY